MAGPTGFPQYQFFRATITPAAVATITTAEQTFTVTGVKLAWRATVIACAPSLVAGVAIATARISADDTVAITFVNPTAGNVTPVAGEYRFTVFRE